MRKSIFTFVATIMVATALSAVAQAPASATPDHYAPRNGPAFNNPYGKERQVRTLIRQVNRTIDSVPKGGKIRISAWNVRSYHIVSALLRAHQRKVSVQVIMDRHNWNPNNPNRDAARLKDGLKVGNKKRSVSDKSWLRRCLSSCRAKHGIPHTKFFLFNKVKDKRKKKVSTVRNVIMYGSFNATELGATIQWNDLYTIKNQPARYSTFLHVFKQMSKDKNVKQGFLTYDDGVVANQFYPYLGKGTENDPVISTLNAVSCKGAATSNGRTRIRIAQTAMYGDRGLQIARKLAQLQRQGCGIRLVYAMFGNQVLKILRTAGVPLTHLAYDSNYDGLYDRYVHMKSMAISGKVLGNPAAKVTWNGSANWTPVALASDEVLGTVRKNWVTNRYMQWIDYLFTHRPAAWGTEHPGNHGGGATGRPVIGATVPLSQEAYAAVVERRAKARGVDPYALIKEEN